MDFIAKWTPARVTSIYIIALLSVFLLAVGSAGYTAITFFKYVLFLAISGLYLLSLVPALLWHRHDLDLKARLTPIHCAVALFFLFSAVSAVHSEFFPATLLGFDRHEGLLTLACYMLCFFGISLFAEVKKIHLAVFAGAMTVFCLVCLVQFTGANPLWLYPSGLNYYDGNDAYRYQFLGTVGNVGLVGAVLSLAAPVFTVAIARNAGKSRFLLLIPLLLVVIVTVYARVAAAIVAVFGGTLLLLPLLMIETKKRRRIVGILLLLLLIVAVACVFLIDIGDGTLHECHALLHGQWDDDFGTGRLYIWRNVLTLVPEHPLFGGGPDSLGQRGLEGFQRYDAAKGVTYRAAIDAAHNEYLNILVNEGALALVAYLAAQVLSWVFLLKYRDNAAVAAWGAAAVGYALQSFFAIRLCIVTPLFFLTWAMMMAAAKPRL